VREIRCGAVLGSNEGKGMVEVEFITELTIQLTWYCIVDHSLSASAGNSSLV